uniref:Uncharacterized protein n=1 Tax=viral metagenome TaxID=1070528 RepID=A0A6H2A021_9ZZZZ
MKKCYIEKNVIYKCGCMIIYKQHTHDCNSLLYSLDEGVTWNDTPVDLGKINYYQAWYKLKE